MRSRALGARSREEVRGRSTSGHGNADDYRLGRGWDAKFAWRFHTGWPTTRSRGEARGALPSLGNRTASGSRVPRLDARLSRRWPIRLGALTVFGDVQNLYNRRNVAGSDLEIDDESGEIFLKTERWPGFFASVGVSL